MEKRGPSYPILLSVKVDNHSGKQYGGFLKNEIFSYHMPQQSHSWVYTQENHSSNNTCSPMFIAALFTVARTWKQPKTWQHQKVNSCCTKTPLSDIPEGHWCWRNIPVSRTLTIASGCPLYSGEMDRCVNIYQFIGFGQWFGGMFKAFEGKWLEIDDKEICKRVMLIISLNGHKIWRYLCPMWIFTHTHTHTKSDLSRIGYYH